MSNADPTLKAWRRLGCAILVRAHKDAHNRNGYNEAQAAGISSAVGLAGDARAFLASDGARWLVAALDLDPATLDRIVDTLPTPFCEQLALPDL